ncbi:C-GCAxxG-C-C family protein [Treponema sp.]
MMNVQEMQKRGLELFGAGYNCAQATFAALAPSFGMDEESAIKTASMFGGGVARSGALCGAVSGALMALGLKLGGLETSPAIKTAMYEKGKAFMAAFKDMHASTDCKDLIDCDLSTPEGNASASARKVHSSICARLVQEAIKMAAEFQV